jgi:hypothetical protein
MSTNNTETAEPEIPPIHRELSAEIQNQLNLIVASDNFTMEATLQSAFTGIKNLALSILGAPAAIPQWRADDLEEQLAAARHAIDRLATLEGPPQSRADFTA